MPKIKATRTCREFIERYKDVKVNCATCVKQNKETGRCRDEEGLKARYEDTEVFDIHDKLMRGNKGVFMG